MKNFAWINLALVSLALLVAACTTADSNTDTDQPGIAATPQATYTPFEE